MVKQGDIIKISFDPGEGHEQAGYRPAVVVSNDYFNRRCAMTWVCPVTNTVNDYPLHVPLDGRTATSGVVMCEQLRSMDLSAREYRFVEALPKDLLRRIVDIIEAVTEPDAE